ncbi:hypothetical protein OH492_03285 [Vibrio chagasii]|nr:hypothetical protein [Vibrio chagasii]
MLYEDATYCFPLWNEAGGTSDGAWRIMDIKPTGYQRVLSSLVQQKNGT